MTLYDDMAEWALDMLTEFGSDAVIQRKITFTSSQTITTTTNVIQNTKTLSPAPWVSPETTTLETPCKAVVTNYHESVLDGSTIKQGDKKIIVAARGMAIEPAVTDVIVCNGVAYNIVAVSVVSPAGTPVVYIVQARL